MTFGPVELWVFVAVAAAGFQTLRFMLQKVLSTDVLSPTGATFARFVYSAPIIALLLAIYLTLTGQAVTPPDGSFWRFAFLGGSAQVIATICVVTLFKSRNFAVGVTLMKTEVILSVVLGIILLGEGVGPGAFAAIALGLIGVLLLSTPAGLSGASGWMTSGIWSRSMALGLGSGALFAISAVSYRGASLAVASSDPVVRAGITLAVVTAMQTLGMALWLAWRDKAQIRAVWRARRVALWIGVLSLCGSFCWFFAFTLQTAAYVKAVGQVELVFSLLASVLFFGERSSVRELWGMAVLCTSILALVLLI